MRSGNCIAVGTTVFFVLVLAAKSLRLKETLRSSCNFVPSCLGGKLFIMIIKEKIGNLKDIDIKGRVVDYLELEWYETNKRILHKKTKAAKEIVLKFLNKNKDLTEGDILYEDAKELIVVSIKPCAVMVIKPKSMYEIAYACYEIGNKHLPLFYENEELLVPYEAPLYKMLQASGFALIKEQRKLINRLRTSVLPHGYSSESKTLFSRILQLTSSNE
jgi:urease accessory protein